MKKEQEPVSGRTSRQPAQSAKKTSFTLDERRDSTRFQHDEGMEFAAIWLETGEEILAEVHDDSLGGLGILLEDSFGFQPGSDVQVVYAGEHLQGKVRHITMQSDGRHMIGLECRRALPKDAD